MKTLYVHRKLKNSEDLVKWAKSQGFSSTVDDPHVTVAFSKNPVDWDSFTPDKNGLVNEGSSRGIQVLGENKDAIVLRFSSKGLKNRWQEFQNGGASWDHDEYMPHVTLSYKGGPEDLTKVNPYEGPLMFGPEVFEEVKEDWKDEVVEKSDPTDLHIDGANLRKPKKKKKIYSNILKVDDDQRMVYGWASVISENGVPVIDLQEDVIDSSELEKATTEFMLDVRHAMVMHDRDENNEIQDHMLKGAVVHSFPLTDELKKALGVTSPREGWIVGVKVQDDEVWKGVKSGKYAGFSIGASAVREKING